MRLIGCAALFIAIGTINACMSFQPLEAGVCGNKVKDENAGEDCDGFPIEGTACGEPGETNACRLLCAEEPKTCPQGYMCGTDGICRAPSGQFKISSAAFEEDAERILIGDFDGDGAKDALVVGAVEQRVHYFDANGAPASTQTILGVSTHPAVGQLTASANGGMSDPMDDFAFLVGGGIGVMRGHPGRTFAPAQYPAVVVPGNIAFSVFLIDAINTGAPINLFPGDEVLGIFQSAAKPTHFAITTADEVSSAAYDYPLPGKLLGDVAVAELYGGLGEPPCEEAVFATAASDGQSTLSILSPCLALLGDPKGFLSIGLKGAKLLGPPRLADMNGDGKIDIVAGGYVDKTLNQKPQKCHVIALALNEGDGTFNLQTNEVELFDEYQSPDACYFDEKQPLTLLAAGDITGDGQGDYIDGLGIHIRLGSVFVHASIPNARWSSALIDDFNADGLLDAATGSEDTPGITFLQGTSEPDTPLNPVLIPTELPTNGFISGYFDNDSVRDIAVIERSTFDPKVPVNTTGDVLSVLYGRALTSPDPPVQMGRLDTIHRMISGGSVKLATFPDGMSDIVVTAGRTPPNQVGATDFSAGLQNVYFFSGSADRTLQSPFRLITAGEPMNPADQERHHIPRQIALGQFDGDINNQMDIAAITTHERSDGPQLVVDYFAWLIPGGADAALAPTMKDELLPLDVPLSAPSERLNDKAPNIADLKLFNATMGAINLDGAGADELVGFSTTAAGVRISIFKVEDYTVTYKDPQNNDAERALKRFALNSVIAPEMLKKAEQITFADVNGDGLQDILGIFTLSEGLDGAPPDQRLMVFENNAPGLDNLSAASFKEIPNPPESFGAPPEAAGMAVRTFALLNADLDPAVEIAVITNANTFLYDLADKAYKFDPKDKDKPEDQRNYVVAPGGDVAAAGDFNNDGLDDLIIGDSTANVVSVYRGAPTNPK